MNNKFLMIAIFIAVSGGVYLYTNNSQPQSTMENKEAVVQPASGSAMTNENVAEFTVE